MAEELFLFTVKFPDGNLFTSCEPGQIRQEPLGWSGLDLFAGTIHLQKPFWLRKERPVCHVAQANRARLGKMTHNKQYSSRIQSFAPLRPGNRAELSSTRRERGSTVEIGP